MMDLKELNEFLKKQNDICVNHIACKNCPLLSDSGVRSCTARYGEVTQEQLDAVISWELPVDWSQVPINTRVVVWLDRLVQHKRYFAGYNDGKICTFQSGATSWSNEPTPLEKWTYGRLAEEDE